MRLLCKAMRLRLLLWLAVFSGAGLGLPSWADFAPGQRVPLGTATGQTLAWNGFSWQPVTFLYATGSAVGIGTASPNAALHVVSPAIATPTLELQAVSGQTSDLLDLYNSTGATKLLSVNTGGSLVVSGSSTFNSSLTVGNGLTTKGAAFQVRTVSASTALTAQDDYIFASGTCTITLPTAASSTKQFVVKDTGTGTITVVSAVATQTFDGGATSVTLSAQNQTRTFQADTANYQIVGGYL